MNQSTVGVVDDNEGVLQSLDGLFASLGYKVRAHLSGEALLSSGDIPTLNCLVSDVDMPGMSGIELLKLVKLEQPNLPVILITGRREEHLSSLAMRSGARYFFVKPLHIPELILAVQSVTHAVG